MARPQHPIRLVLLAVVLAATLGALPAAAQSVLDVRGTWKTVVVAKDGSRFPATLVISDQDDTGRLGGHWDIHGEGDSGRMVGSLTGARMLLQTTKANASYHYSGTVRTRKGALVWSGRWIGPIATWTGTFTATLGEPLVQTSPQGGDRPSAAVVVCNRDMTANVDGAVLACTAQVTDASARPGSTAPTGDVTWTTESGDLTPATCTLTTGSGSTAWCAVTLRAGTGEIPIGSAPPVTASYPGDVVFGPADGAPQLAGGGTGYAESDLWGPGCNAGSVPQPTVGCGDPVNPATGDLVVRVVDLAVGGRGPGLAVDRSYDSLAAAAGEAGRFGAGWSDAYGARVVSGPKGAITVHLGTGATVPFTAKGQRFVAPGWVTASLTRATGRGYTLTLRDGTVRSFDRDGRLTTVADRAGETVSLTYGADGALAAATDASGRMLRFTTLDGHVVSATDPVGRNVRYAYSDAGDLVAVTDVAGATTTYTYDDAHHLTSATDATGSTTSHGYDAAGRIIAQTDPEGASMAFTYLGAFPDLVTVVTDGDGVRDAYEFQRGVLVAATSALDGDAPSTTTHVYDERLRLVATIDPDRDLWRFSRDDAGDLTAMTDPLGGVTTATYDDRGNVTAVVSPGGVTTRFDRDARGLIARIVHGAGGPEEAITTVGRDDPQHPGDITSVTDPMGAKTTFQADANGDLVGRTDALGNSASASRDALGWLVAMTDPTGMRSMIASDTHGRPASLVDALGGTTTLVRDAVGRLLTVTDALGQTTVTARDTNGRPIAVTLPDGATLGTAYDATGHIVSQSDAAGATWAIERDDHGRVTAWVDPVGGRWSAAYDAGGRVTATTDPTGAVTRFTWTVDRLTAVDHEDGTPDVTFAHDADGRRIAMTDGTGTTSITRDSVGRITSVTDGAGATVATTFDLAGNLTAITYPGGGTIQRDQDAAGRLVAVRDWLGNTSTFAWDAADRLIRIVAGDGSVTERTYDPGGGLIGITVTAAGQTQPLLAFTYTRDPVGRIVSTTERLGTGATGPSAEASRDGQGRLIRLGDATFAFDPSGNLAELRGDGLASDAAGRLLSQDGRAGSTRFTNDVAGRRTSAASAATGTEVRYAWDAAGNLTAAGSATFAYDGDGLRVAASWGDGTSSRFTWLHATEAPQLLGDGESWYVRGPDGMPLEEIRADGSVRWLHLDQAGSVRAVTDRTGALIGTSSWDAYGLPVEPIAGASRLGFQGHYTDPGTGLLDLGARPYDPVTGRFLVVDPLVMRTRQPYAFGNGDPLTYGDPSGSDPIAFGSGAGGVKASEMLSGLGLPTALECVMPDITSSALEGVLSGLTDQPAGPGRVRGAVDQAWREAGFALDLGSDLAAERLAEAVGQALAGTLDDLAPFMLQGADDILSGRLRVDPSLGH